MLSPSFAGTREKFHISLYQHLYESGGCSYLLQSKVLNISSKKVGWEGLAGYDGALGECDCVDILLIKAWCHS